MEKNQDLASTWSRYWNSGQTESCPGERANLMAIEDVWRTYFSAMENGARLLDLATGGGHVLRLALETARRNGQTFELEGVDLASLSGVRPGFESVAPSVVRLRDNIDISELPFADALFDGVTSQFGIEYAPSGKSCSEVVRVMKPFAKGQFVLHHKQGAISISADASLAAYRLVFANNTAFQCAKELFERFASGAPSTGVEQEVLRFRNAVRDLRSRIRDEAAYRNSHEIVSFLEDLARKPHMYVPGDTLRRLALAEVEIGAWRSRQQALVASALDHPGVGQLATYLRESGASITRLSEIRDGETLLAWLCIFQKEGVASTVGRTLEDG